MERTLSQKEERRSSRVPPDSSQLPSNHPMDLIEQSPSISRPVSVLEQTFHPSDDSVPKCHTHSIEAISEGASVEAL